MATDIIEPRQCCRLLYLRHGTGYNFATIAVEILETCHAESPGRLAVSSASVRRETSQPDIWPRHCEHSLTPETMSPSFLRSLLLVQSTRRSTHPWATGMIMTPERCRIPHRLSVAYFDIAHLCVRAEVDIPKPNGGSWVSLSGRLSKNNVVWSSQGPVGGCWTTA